MRGYGSLYSPYRNFNGEVERIFPMTPRLKTKYSLKEDVIEIQKIIKSTATNSNAIILQASNIFSLYIHFICLFAYLFICV